jgi:membrane protein implicated in regulation of membrane protease activity
MLILVAIALLLVLPSPWNGIGAAVAILLGIGEIYLWNSTVRGRRARVGAATLIGREAVVVTALAPSGQVRIDGEIWAARGSHPAAVDDTVRIVGRDRLTLIVEPV